jgi:hypothetical protein
MSLEKKPSKAIRSKLFASGAKIVWAPTDEEAERLFKLLLQYRKEWREAGGKFSKK